MFSSYQKKTVKELRKNLGMTVKELAERIKCDNIEVMKIDELCLKEVPEPMKAKLTPVLRGDIYDKIPW
ncbi:MAG: transcriptional regulator [Carboxydocellales bacterium]